jgi:hypothetical protein
MAASRFSSEPLLTTSFPTPSNGVDVVTTAGGQLQTDNASGTPVALEQLRKDLVRQLSGSAGVWVASEGTLSLEGLVFRAGIAGIGLVGTLISWSSSYLAHDLPGQLQAAQQLAQQLPH